ncbi:hypothetical protein LIER_44025 [Lithospermum erythrorhizon]|uniref:Uncharacterized protein n=1 Tax=Lithospermum erythrorhizon TaxID=34254 RepID=A0AAV3RNZ4_LITER
MLSVSSCPNMINCSSQAKSSHFALETLPCPPPRKPPDLRHVADDILVNTLTTSSRPQLLSRIEKKDAAKSLAHHRKDNYHPVSLPIS